ncbi:MAG: hypothetical protein ACK4SY_10335 [Pyrobaculum sp.]
MGDGVVEHHQSHIEMVRRIFAVASWVGVIIMVVTLILVFKDAAAIPPFLAVVGFVFISHLMWSLAAPWRIEIAKDVVTFHTYLGKETYRIAEVERGLDRPRGLRQLVCVLRWELAASYTYCHSGKFYVEVLGCGEWTKVALEGGIELWLCGIDLEKGNIII